MVEGLRQSTAQAEAIPPDGVAFKAARASAQHTLLISDFP